MRALAAGLWLWVATAVLLAVAATAGVRAAVAGAGCVIALVLVGVLLLRGRAGRRALRAALLAAALSAGAAAVVAWRVLPLVSGPVAEWAADRPLVRAEVVTTTDAAPRAGSTRGSRRTDDEWQLDAAALAVARGGGAPVAVDLPVRLLTTADVGRLLPGTRLVATGRLLPGDVVRGRAATLVAESVAEVGAPPVVQGAAGALRESLRRTVRDRPAESAGLLPGLVVGDVSGVPDELDTAMRDSGLAHLTAVSGGNVAVVVLLALGAARALGVRRGRAQVLLVGLAVLAYVVVARPQPSVVRAAAMTAVVLLAVLADLEVRPLDALGLSLGALVLLDPFLALSVGFAMSALATAALLVLAVRWRERPRPPGRVRRVVGVLAAVLAVSAAAQVAVAPLVAGIGGGLPVGGVAANLLAEPAVAPATSFGLVAGLLGLVWPAGAAVVALPAAWAVAWIARVARTCAELLPPLPWPRGWAGALGLAALLLLAGAATWLARRQGGAVARACLAVAAVGGLVAVAPPAQVPFGAAWPPPGWRVAMCDVGQGDATVLNAGDGAAVLVDTGPDPARLDACLRRLGVSRVPLLVLSHFHADHVEGTQGALRGRPVSAVVVSPLGEPVGEVARVTRWLAARGLSPRVAAPGDRWSVGAVHLRVVWPTRLLRGEGSDPNNASVVLLGDVGGVTVLLDGDLETAAQEAVLASGVLGRVDVVKVPHHGSAKQSPAWAATTHPAVALVGVGLDNDYGHPSPGTVAAYRAVGAVVGRTDLDGDLAVVADAAHGVVLLHRGP
ncbi:MAG: MBL fold metallo-hydrolase [Frankiales bacterium]|nr:MBL fold metallo-hydrolase [Frankiales bacterium]